MYVCVYICIYIRVYIFSYRYLYICIPMCIYTNVMRKGKEMFNDDSLTHTRKCPHALF